MDTLRDLREASDSAPTTGVDNNTPDGHFYAAAWVFGIFTCYLLAGSADEADSSIVGRIEYSPGQVMNVYRGDGLKGGRLLCGVTDEAVAFERMTEGAR